MKAIQILVTLLLMANTGFAQLVSESIWTQVTDYTKTQINDPAILEQVNTIQENSKQISKNPTADHSKDIQQIQSSLRQLHSQILSLEPSIQVNLKARLQEALFYQTVSPILLSQTPQTQTASYFSMLNFKSSF